MAAPQWVQQGIALVGVSAPFAAMAAGVAWAVAKATANHGSKVWLQSHKGDLDRELEAQKGALNRELEGYRSLLTAEADQHRLLLKRQELMFAREVEAAEAYTKLFRKLYPKARIPEPDWADAQLSIAESIGAFENGLDKFLAAHSVAISAKVLRYLEHARVVAEQTGFEVGADTQTGSYNPGEYPNKAVCDGVDEVFKNMTKAFEAIREDLRTGSMGGSSIGSDKPEE